MVLRLLRVTLLEKGVLLSRVMRVAHRLAARPVVDHARRDNAVGAPLNSPKSELVVVPLVADGDKFADRYPANLSSRSKAARNQTLADMLWKRSNTNGDLLKHTDEERNASRLRRQVRPRHSMPTELVAERASSGFDNSRDDFNFAAVGDHPPHVTKIVSIHSSRTHAISTMNSL